MTPRGLAFEVRTAGGFAWVDAEIAITVSPDPAETWKFVERFTDNRASLRDVAEDFVAWANDASRAWFGTHVFDYALDHTRADRRLSVTLSADASVAAWTPNAAFAFLSGVASSAAASLSLPSSTAAAGTVDTEFAVVNYWKRDVVSPIVSADGAMRAGAASAASRRPGVSATSSAQAAHALQLATREASAPRRAWIYQHASPGEPSEGWRFVAVGNTTTQVLDSVLFTLGLEVLA